LSELMFRRFGWVVSTNCFLLLHIHMLYLLSNLHTHIIV
jgi:hypothetical protein